MTFISLIDRIPADKWYAWSYDIIVVSGFILFVCVCNFLISAPKYSYLHIFIIIDAHEASLYLYTYIGTVQQLAELFAIARSAQGTYTYVNFLIFVVGNMHTRRQSISLKRDALKSISRVMFTGLGVCKLYKSLCIIYSDTNIVSVCIFPTTVIIGQIISRYWIGISK